MAHFSNTVSCIGWGCVFQDVAGSVRHLMLWLEQKSFGWIMTLGSAVFVQEDGVVDFCAEIFAVANAPLLFSEHRSFIRFEKDGCFVKEGLQGWVEVFAQQVRSFWNEVNCKWGDLRPCRGILSKDGGDPDQRKEAIWSVPIRLPPVQSFYQQILHLFLRIITTGSCFRAVAILCCPVGLLCGGPASKANM